MQVKGDCEEKFQQFKEEESNKLQALQEEFTAALAASRGTPFVEVNNYLDIDYTHDGTEMSSNKFLPLSFRMQTATKSIDQSEAAPTVNEGSVANILASNASEAPTVLVQNISLLIAPMMIMEYMLISYLSFPYAGCP